MIVVTFKGLHIERFIYDFYIFISMIKKAILVKGEPIIIDDLDEFNVNSKRNVSLMSEISIQEGYEVQYATLDKMIKAIRRSIDAEKFIFYFTGHANKEHIGTLNYKTNSVLEAMKEIPGEKLIVLDSCSGDYRGGRDFEALNVPENSRIITAKEIYDSKSLAKLLYDAVILRKIKLDEVDKKTFEEMKHNWVYFKRNK